VAAKGQDFGFKYFGFHVKKLLTTDGHPASPSFAEASRWTRMGKGNKTLSGTDTGSLFGEVPWQGSSIDFRRLLIRVHSCSSAVELNRFG
jgi:hypothetical protein